MELPFLPYRFAYLAGSLYLFSIWVFLAWRVTTHRQASFVFGLFYMWFAVLGVFLWYTVDWWHPLTITFSRMGPEDLIASFAHFALPLLFGRYVFRYNSSAYLSIHYRKKRLLIGFFGLFILLTLIPGILFAFFHIHSFTALIIALLVGSLITIVCRPDLLVFSTLNGLLMAILALSMFLLGTLVSPGVVSAFWDFSNLSGTIFLTAPVEDIIFYTLWGFFMGSFYEFLFGIRLEKISKSPLEHDSRLVFRFLFRKP